MKSISKENRPWGRFYVIHDEKNYKLKRIEVEPGNRLSYQYHNKRSETWILVKGQATVTINDKVMNYKQGETLHIPVREKHRVENKSDELLVFIEVQTGKYFGEDDIVRIEDDYNRK